MPCAKPLTMFRFADGSTGFSASEGDVIAPQYVACGQCAMCRRAKAAEWCTRLMHEGYTSSMSACITLTYADEHLPPLASLAKADVELFMKRLRYYVAKRGGAPIRFDACGEYSPDKMRPHYHLALFGYWPPDAKRWGLSRGGNQEWVSEELTNAWGKGWVTFQPWSAGAANYCAGHQAWKLTGALSRERLAVKTADGIVIGDREPEFHHASNRPGIGARFFERYGTQMLELGFTVIDGRKCPVPKYYLRLGELSDPDRVSQLRADRELQAAAAVENSTYERLAVREECAQAALDRSARNDAMRPARKGLAL